MSIDPIEHKHREVMNVLAKELAELFKGFGFALFVFDLNFAGRMNYISNGQRVDMIAAMKEWIAVMENRVHEGNKEPI